jgi:DNA-binding transcriptional ArsR family regulator
VSEDSKDEAAGGAQHSVKRLTDPRALRAYAHPIRLALVGLLRREGPLTATRAAELLGESTGSTSFHLRQLAKYGFVEEAGGGRGREKPWRPAATFFEWPGAAATPELAAATGLLETVLAERYFDELMRWLEAKPAEPQEWREAALFGDYFVYLTADELAEIGRAYRGLLDRFVPRVENPELRPPGSREVTVLHVAHPRTTRNPPRGLGSDPGTPRTPAEGPRRAAVKKSKGKEQ